MPSVPPSCAIHALPGLGADRRMFPGPWKALPGFVAHDWPRHKGEGSLGGLARSVAEEYGIRDGDVVAGASLGGMVGCEIAKIRKLRALFLVGSAVSHAEVNRFFAFQHRLIDLAPIRPLKFLSGLVPLSATQMFAGCEPVFVRTMCRAIFEWDGLGACAVPLFRIHGRWDWLIHPPARPGLLLNGGHLISMTHARQCAEFVRAAGGF